MKVALLIHAHKMAEQVARLCGIMSHPNIDIYINIDSKSDIAPFREKIPAGRFVEPRTDIRWGEFSQVEATLNSLRFISESGVMYDYIAFVSGQDYPIVAPTELLAQLESGGAAEYMSYRKLSPATDVGTLRKAEYYHLTIRNKRLGIALRRATYLLPFMRRRYPLYPIYKGSSWWTLTGECVDYIIRFSKQSPKYQHFHRHTHCPDELYFHNIVMHSPFAPLVTGSDMRHIEWPDGSPNPTIFEESDFEGIMQSGKWFARKFDMNIDNSILDMMDRVRR